MFARSDMTDQMIRGSLGMDAGLTYIQNLVTVAWWFALDFSVLLYIVLDGADLGAGVFSLFVRSHHERGAIMSAWPAPGTRTKPG
jgi:hypothetical protein